MANPAVVTYDSISEIDQSNPNLSTEFDSLQFPPLDADFLTNDLIFNNGVMADLEFDDDFDFNFDDLSLPSETEDFLLREGPDFFSSTVPVVCQDSGNGSGSVEISRASNSLSPESGTSDQEFSGRVSSQDSGVCRSVVDGFLNSPSPDSGVHSESPSEVIAGDDASDRKIKSEEESKVFLPKRKKEKEEEENPNPRSTKFQRSTSPDDNVNSNGDEEDKKKTRLIRNRESAQLSRQRKKHYVEELEDKVRSMHSMIADLNNKVSFVMAENASLRQQLSGGGGVVYPPHAMTPMPYSWIPCASYPVRPQGSQVPLVPIPRIKPQQPKSAPKGKKSESKKNVSKTKKVASVSFVGLLFFVFLFGGLVPFVNVSNGRVKEMVPNGSGFNGRKEGRVVSVSGHLNSSDQSVGVGLCTGKSVFWSGGAKGTHCKSWTEGDGSEIKQNNASDPLVASLYVPRNDKLVKIDGNLIIQSVLASEKAMASSHAMSSANEARETSLAIARNLVPHLGKSGRNVERNPHLYRSLAERQRAITSGSRDNYKDNSKSTAADGSLQKWFRDGLAGPILSSGMCTEVFQFNVSPDSAKPGAIIQTRSTANVSTKHRPGSNKRMNRRILDPLPIPFTGSAFNGSDQDVGRASQNGSINGNKSVSSMVVSVLVDPREAGYNEGDGVIPPKSLPRIFVVVLIDSVKYVTYSCMLPLKGSSPNLVTT